MFKPANNEEALRREAEIKQWRKEREEQSWATKRDHTGRKNVKPPNPGVAAEDFVTTNGNGLAGLVSTEQQKAQIFKSNRTLWGQASKTENPEQAAHRIQNEPYREPYRNPGWDDKGNALAIGHSKQVSELKPYKKQTTGLGFQGHAILPGEPGAGEVFIGPRSVNLKQPFPGGNDGLMPELPPAPKDPEGRDSTWNRDRIVKTAIFDKAVGPKRLITSTPGKADGKSGKFPLWAPEAWTENKRKIKI